MTMLIDPPIPRLRPLPPYSEKGLKTVKDITGLDAFSHLAFLAGGQFSCFALFICRLLLCFDKHFPKSAFALNPAFGPFPAMNESYNHLKPP